VELKSIARPAADWSGAADWWTFNGNAERTGYVPVTVDPTVLRMLWNDMVLSGLNLQPVAEADGRAFVASGIRWGVQTTEQRLAAVNVQTGALIWSHSFGPVPFLNPPTVSGGLVYASTVGHSLHYLWAFDAATGAVVFSAPYDNQWSRYGAPAVGGGGVYMGGGYVGGIYAFSAADGTPHWFTDFGYEWIWADQWTPAFRAGRVYAYLGMKNSAAVSVGKFVIADAATGAAQVLIDDPDFVFDNSLHSSAVLGSANNALMTLRNRLVSFDVANQRIGWQIEAAFRGTVTLADGVIYVINGQRVEARSEQAGALLWYWTSPDSNLLGAVIATRNLLFVSTPNSVYAIDIGARVHTWRHVGGGHLSLTRDGVLLIAEESGVLTAIGLK
jgi:outer membrane protein assembly factor BamB